ncbi:hypothetical protein A5696_20295 [Mycobacterium sp. E2699]|nr:hypothetical protein A5696_20295 [Mycobacterium sp. E2699]OBI48355.1 hypothetical protein A5705_00650 [Mycobacterium sp. E787]
MRRMPIAANTTIAHASQNKACRPSRPTGDGTFQTTVGRVRHCQYSGHNARLANSHRLCPGSRMTLCASTNRASRARSTRIALPRGAATAWSMLRGTATFPVKPIPYSSARQDNT